MSYEQDCTEGWMGLLTDPAELQRRALAAAGGVLKAVRVVRRDSCSDAPAVTETFGQIIDDPLRQSFSFVGDNGMRRVVSYCALDGEGLVSFYTSHCGAPDNLPSGHGIVSL